MSKKTAYKIDTKEFVTIGGIPQNIRIRTNDPSLPVLLFVHGGPGVCDRFWVMSHQSGLADCATIVCWDQRCAGLTYNPKENYDGITVERMLDDAGEVAAHLKERFNKDKIIIVGHSWGSLLGALLAQKYPEHIGTYIGMGQLADGPENEMLSYRYVLEQANERNDKKALKELKKIGWPQNGLFRTLDDFMIQRKWLGTFGGGTYGAKESTVKMLLIPLLKSPEYNLSGLIRYIKGGLTSIKYFWNVVPTYNLCNTIKELKMPVYMTIGRHDYNTPASIAQKWYDGLKAPSKKWIWFENSAHAPIKEEAEKWQAEVKEIIRTCGVA